MPSQFERVLRDGSDAIAGAIRPKPVDAVRARGDQRRRRQVIGSVVTVVAVLAAGGVATMDLAATAGASTPAPVTAHRSHHHERRTITALIVPNTVGLAVPDAVSILSAAGLRVRTEAGACGRAVPRGTVCQTEPAAGTIAPVGTTVVVEVPR